MTVNGADALLRKVLLVNATATAASGAAFLALGHVFAPVFGLAPAVLWILGVGFLAFAAHLWHTARKAVVTHGEGLYFAAADTAYVLATVLVLVAFPTLLSTAGRIVFGLLADVVAVFAIAEFIGARRLSRSQPAAA